MIALTLLVLVDVGSFAALLVEPPAPGAVPAAKPVAQTLPAQAGPAELKYRGTFTKVAHGGEEASEPLKRFDVYCLAAPRTGGGRDLGFVVEEHGGSAMPWPARYGTIPVDAKNRTDPSRMRLLHEHDGTTYVLTVPSPYFEFADRLAADSRWEAARKGEFGTQRDASPWKYHVSGSEKVGPRSCWRVNVVNNFGPQESLWVEQGTPLVVKAERRIVIGRGDVHVLRLELDSIATLADEKLQRLRRPFDALLRLQAELKRPDEDKTAELSDPQLKTAAAALKSLEEASEGTPFERLVAAIGRDVNTQSRRAGDVDSLARRFVGKPAPAVQLKPLDGESVDPGKQTGKIVLLHFWSYQGDPFPSEPYGQVGYLEFLHNRRRKLGLQVYGIAVNQRLSDKSETPSVTRSVRKLQSFMNISYPLVLDDGTLLEKFGDPVRTGSKLPLWVLIGPDGTVKEYKVGTYDIKADEGLTQLDRAVLALIRAQRKMKSP